MRLFQSPEVLEELDSEIHDFFLSEGGTALISDELYSQFQRSRWEGLAREWSTMASPYRPSKGDIEIYNAFLNAIPNRKRILLLGATPELRDLLSEYPSSFVVVVDFSYMIIAELSKLLKKADPNKEIWVKSDWRNLTFFDKTFDIIVGDIVILQFPPNAETHFLRATSDLLKPRGHFLTRVLHRQKVSGSGPNFLIKRVLSAEFSNDFARAFALYDALAVFFMADSLRKIERKLIRSALQRAITSESFDTEQKATLTKAYDIIIKNESSGYRWWLPPSREELHHKLGQFFEIRQEKAASDYKDAHRYPILDLVLKNQSKNDRA